MRWTGRRILFWLAVSLLFALILRLLVIRGSRLSSRTMIGNDDIRMSHRRSIDRPPGHGGRRSVLRGRHVHGGSTARERKFLQMVPRPAGCYIVYSGRGQLQPGNRWEEPLQSPTVCIARNRGEEQAAPGDPLHPRHCRSCLWNRGIGQEMGGPVEPSHFHAWPRCWHRRCSPRSIGPADASPKCTRFPETGRLKYHFTQTLPSRYPRHRGRRVLSFYYHFLSFITVYSHLEGRLKERISA